MTDLMRRLLEHGEQLSKEDRLKLYREIHDHGAELLANPNCTKEEFDEFVEKRIQKAA